jgi:hypothetical protein
LVPSYPVPDNRNHQWKINCITPMVPENPQPTAAVNTEFPKIFQPVSLCIFIIPSAEIGDVINDKTGGIAPGDAPDFSALDPIAIFKRGNSASGRTRA